MKYKWVVIPLRDGYIVARNGKDGIPEIVDHYYYYLDKKYAEVVAEELNDTEEDNL